MSRPLRNTDPNYLRLFTIRTFEERFYLRPSEYVNQIIGGVISRYQEKYQIEIFAYNVLSNHIHLLLRAPHQNLWRFAQEVDREIAQRINRHMGRTGYFWGRRYDEQICLDESNALEALIYISCNPVSHRLVKHAHTWPGISSYRYGILGEEKAFLFTHYTSYRLAKLKAKKGQSVRLSDYQTLHTLKLSQLPIFEKLDSPAYREKIKGLVLERETELIARYENEGLSFLGRRKILEQHYFERPSNPKKSERPLCYTKCFDAKRRFMDWYFAWCAEYKKASAKLRSGLLDAIFPEHCLKPPLHYWCGVLRNYIKTHITIAT